MRNSSSAVEDFKLNFVKFLLSQWNSLQRQEFVHGSPIDACQRIQAVNAGKSYFCFRCREDGWEQSQKRVAGAFSQGPHLLREPHATTIRVADGSPSVLHRDLLAAPAWP